MLRQWRLLIEPLNTFTVKGNGDMRHYSIDWDSYDGCDALLQYFASDVAHDHYQYLMDVIPY